MDLAPFKHLLKERTGLLFEGERQGTLKAGIRARMLKRGMEYHGGYLDCLVRDQEEIFRLLNLLTVKETYFFREPAHIELFSGHLVPELLAGKGPGDRVRILSAGCATGEEPFSLVMALMEKYGEEEVRRLFSFTAVDIASDALERAKKGGFGSGSFRRIDEGLKKKYFRAIGGNRYELSGSVRDKVEFQIFNLQSKSYPDVLRGMDVIFYKNVSIYFEPKKQAAVFRKLSRLLNSGGYLFVSPAETLQHDTGVLSLVQLDGQFIYKKDTAARGKRSRRETRRGQEPVEPVVRAEPVVQIVRAEPVVQIVRAEPAPQAKETLKGPEEFFDEALSLARNKRYEEALNSVERFILERPSSAGAHALKASILTMLQRPAEAREVCLKTVEVDRWHLESYLLLGFIAKDEGSEDESIKRFKEALYVQPSCWLAHFYLAQAYHRRGRTGPARREYGVVIKQLERGGMSNHGLTFFPLSFSAGEVMHLCRHNLKELKKAEVCF